MSTYNRAPFWVTQHTREHELAQEAGYITAVTKPSQHGTTLALMVLPNWRG